MHDATSRMERMYHVNKTMCHEEGIHCVNKGLGHMSMEKENMAMHEGPVKGEYYGYGCMGACMKALHGAKGCTIGTRTMPT